METDEKTAEEIVLRPKGMSRNGLNVFSDWQGMVVSGQVNPVYAYDYWKEKVAPIFQSLINEALTEAREEGRVEERERCAEIAKSYIRGNIKKDIISGENKNCLDIANAIKDEGESDE